MTSPTQINHGGSAFPCEGGADSGLYSDPGMSLRDYFAAAALAGLLASPREPCAEDGASHLTAERYSDLSYKIAAAMIAAREPSHV